MKYIILVQQSENDGMLTKLGRKQAYDIAELLITRCSGLTLILNSNFPEAAQTAKIIGAMIDCPTQEEKNLGHTQYDGYKQVIEKIKAMNEGKTRYLRVTEVILVTHRTFCSEFPDHFGVNKFGKRLGSISLQNGEGLIIDCEKQTMKKLT